MLRLLCLVAAVLLAQVPAGATDKLDGDAIRRAFDGNTVSGRYTNGVFFTEYHHPDGRALGHNGWQANTDACWITKADQVCYYYGPPEQRTTHCFTVEVTNRVYVLRNVGSGRVNAVATIEPGNPRGHADKGDQWYCDGLISQAPAKMTPRGRMLASR